MKDQLWEDVTGMVASMRSTELCPLPSYVTTTENTSNSSLHNGKHWFRVWPLSSAEHRSRWGVLVAAWAVVEWAAATTQRCLIISHPRNRMHGAPQHNAQVHKGLVIFVPVLPNNILGPDVNDQVGWGGAHWLCLPVGVSLLSPFYSSVSPLEVVAEGGNN